MSALPDITDYHRLRKQGLQYIEELSSDVWTDYNTHDPGITQLEHLCYGLTDLGYRTNHDMADLLASGSPIKSHSEFSPRQILPCRPLTILDYRKLIVDVKGVRNAWLETVEGAEPPLFYDADKEALTLAPNGKTGAPNKDIVLRGFYKVWYQLEQDVADAATVHANIVKQLQAHRNLCELFRAICPIPEERIGLCLDLDLDPQVDSEEVLAQAVHAIDRFISPVIPFYHLREMLAAGYSTEEIFLGPLLEHGFVLDSELAAARLRPEIHISDLIQIVMDIAGVRGVKRLLLTSYSYDVGLAKWLPKHKGQKWVLPLTSGTAPRLWYTPFSTVEDEVSRFLFYKNGIPFTPNREQAWQRLDERKSEDRKRKQAAKGGVYPSPAGVKRRIGNYYSIQHEFPLNYGIGTVGLPKRAGDERRARAKQLKAYLAIMEQFLANYLAELSELRTFFSLDEIDSGAFVQIPDDIPDLDDLLGPAATWPDLKGAIQDLLQDEAQFLQQRADVLSHLLARFGESFVDYAAVSLGVANSHNGTRLIGDMIRFLTMYPEISRDRAAALNITNTHIGEPNVSGLELRLRALLGGLRDYFVIVPKANGTFSFHLENEAGQVLLTSTDNFSEREKLEAAIGAVILNGLNTTNLVGRTTPKGKYSIELKDENDRVIARQQRYFSKPLKRDVSLSLLQLFFRDLPPTKRVILLEHILLTPILPNDEMLPACTDFPTTGCRGLDPYSFRVSMIMPYWLVRFRNMHFRAFIERTIREHLPAHIFARICWLNQAQMVEFEAVYGPWREALAGTDLAARRLAQNELIKVWTRLRSVFPPATLQDCTEGDNENPTVLGNVILGSG